MSALKRRHEARGTGALRAGAVEASARQCAQESRAGTARGRRYGQLAGILEEGKRKRGNVRHASFVTNSHKVSRFAKLKLLQEIPHPLHVGAFNVRDAEIDHFDDAHFAGVEVIAVVDPIVSTFGHVAVADEVEHAVQEAIGDISMLILWVNVEVHIEGIPVDASPMNVFIE